MPSTIRDLPFGHSIGTEAPIRSSVELGAIIREQRKRLALKQLDLAGLGNTGNRFIVDLENGKPTVQLQKVLDLMDLLGLEVVVRAKAARTQARSIPGSTRDHARTDAVGTCPRREAGAVRLVDHQEAGSAPDSVKAGMLTHVPGHRHIGGAMTSGPASRAARTR